jgi:hypothetical protein
MLARALAASPEPPGEHLRALMFCRAGLAQCIALAPGPPGKIKLSKKAGQGAQELVTQAHVPVKITSSTTLPRLTFPPMTP